tara:strand:- start:362 stop:772 length:411 start_codon:yes stop_codon:yes gene_type:complete
MKKGLLLLSLLILLNGCAESIALFSTGASNGKIVQSSLNSAITYGVKKQTGKTPLEHAITFAEEKNPEKKRETCVSFIERTRSEFCTVAKKQISITNTVLAKKSSEIKQKFTKKNIIKKTSLIENIAKKSVIYNRR